jgi:hypothetical protein
MGNKIHKRFSILYNLLEISIRKRRLYVLLLVKLFLNAVIVTYKFLFINIKKFNNKLNLSNN